MIPVAFDATPKPSPDSNLSLRQRVAEFEGMLLSQILERLKDAYRLPGAVEIDATGESFQSLANSALGNGLAAQGGLGVTDLLIKSLTRNPTSHDVKESPPSADQIPEVGGKH